MTSAHQVLWPRSVLATVMGTQVDVQLGGVTMQSTNGCEGCSHFGSDVAGGAFGG